MSELLTCAEIEIEALENHLTKLRAENKRLREALKFYAHQPNYTSGLTSIGLASSIIRDFGDIAREALKEPDDA